MIRKETLLQVLRDFPDEFSIDELLDRLIVLNKIEKGVQQAKDGEVYTQEEARKLLEKWLK